MAVRVLIAGAGIAGLTTALSLHADPHYRCTATLSSTAQPAVTCHTR